MAEAGALPVGAVEQVPRVDDLAPALDRLAEVERIPGVEELRAMTSRLPRHAEVARGAAEQERGILTDVIEARARATSIQITADDLDDPAKMAEFQAAQNQLGAGLGLGITPGSVFETAAGARLVVESVGEPFHRTDGPVDTKWHPYEIGHWVWFAIRTEHFDPSDAQRMPDELVDIVDARWWTADELATSGERYEPDDLPDLIRRGIDRLR